MQTAHLLKHNISNSTIKFERMRRKTNGWRDGEERERDILVNWKSQARE